MPPERTPHPSPQGEGRAGSPGPHHRPKGRPSVVSLRSRGIPLWNIRKLREARNQLQSARQDLLDIVFGFVVFVQLQNWLTVYGLLVTFVCTVFFSFQKDGGLAPEVSWGWTLVCFSMVLPVLGMVWQGLQRRNEAVREVSEVKSCCLAIYLAHRDWASKPTEAQLDSIRGIIKDLWDSLHCYLHQTWFTTHHYSTNMPQGDNLPRFLVVSSQEMIINIRRIFSVTKDLSQACQKLRDRGASSEAVAQLHATQRGLQRAICQLSHLKEYRTPQGLRSMARIYIVIVMPLFFAPMWARVKKDAGFVYAIVLSLMVHLLVVGLLNLAIMLEDPFDDSALDGVSIYEASDQISWVIQEGNAAESPALSLKNVRLESPATNGHPPEPPKISNFDNQTPTINYSPGPEHQNGDIKTEPENATDDQQAEPME
ncbi:hypothetical protein BSKO_12021 [Bryopsis sp. KO-2023]|nr:hypothetical protein BSKO_12021 [Bryopsis sp. KO-2023]